MNEINVVIQQATNKLDIVIQPLTETIPIEISMTKPAASVTTANVKEALDITVLNGANTGDQDLSGLVDKVTDKSLVLDTEITKLGNISGTNTGDQDITSLVPYTGATANLDLGIRDLSAANINITGAYKIGAINRLGVQASFTLIYDGGGGQTLLLGTSGNFYRNTTHSFGSKGGATEYMKILGNGDVGIGAANPVSKLEIGSGQISNPSGVASSPSYSFTGDLDTGMFQSAGNTLNFATAGSERLKITTTAVIFRIKMAIPSGTVAAPGMQFDNESSTGIYRPGAGALGFSVLGSLAANLTATGLGLGVTNPNTKLHVAGAITQNELSADPTNPDEGSSVQWQSDGTGSGDDGDIMMKITAGGVTKTVTIIDFSAI